MAIGYNYNEWQNAKQRRKNHFVRDLVIGTTATAGFIGARALKEENRADSFIKTSKNCLKDFTKKNQKECSEFARFIKLDKAANWIDKIGTKNMCAAMLAISIPFWGWMLGGVYDWIRK